MTFALAPALWGLALLPLLVLLRILDRRPRIVVVPSLIPWRAAASAQAPAGSRRPLLDWPLALQLAAAGAVVMGASAPQLTRPSGKGARARRAVVVLDNSPSMGARSSGGHSRLEEARGRLEAELRGARIDEAALVLSSPEPRLLVEPFSGIGRVSAELAAARPAGASGDLARAVAAARAAAGPDALVLLASDNLAPVESLLRENAITIRVGQAAHNMGLIAAAAEDGRIFAAVRNASPEDATARLALFSEDGREMDSAAATIGAGRRQSFVFRIPPATSGTVELRLPHDDLDADNSVRLYIGEKPAPIFLGSAAPSLARALNAMGLREAAGLQSATGSDGGLVVASGQWPREVPAKGFALIVNPPEGGLAGISAAGEAPPAEARLGEGAPELFPGAASYRFAIPSARALTLGPGSRVLLGDAGRPLMVLSADGSACVLAFDPETTEWVKHASFPIFLARLAGLAPRFDALCRSARREGLLSDEETACRVAGREIRAVAPFGKVAFPKGAPLAPWLFGVSLVLLAVEWRLAARGRSAIA